MKMKTKTNIDVSLIKTQKYEKNIKNEAIKNENILKKPGKKRIKIYNFFSINESKICNKISKIPNYFNNYQKNQLSWKLFSVYLTKRKNKKFY